MKTTDIKSFCEQLQENLKVQLDKIGFEHPDAISKASKCMVAVSEAINKLKAFVHDYSFRNSEEEINFFKGIKPVLLSQYYYYKKLSSIKINEPFDSETALRNYYIDQLKELQQFIKANAEFYRYCLSNSTDLDEKYFTRSGSSLKSPDIDTQFSTGHDNTLARILACQLTKDYLTGLIHNLDKGLGDRGTNLKWTGTKSALIELIYAIHSVDSVNEGRAGIKQIADSFESMFNISLGNYYRLFQEIRQRKSSQTTFLDLMKEKFIQRMSELDEK